MQLAVEVSQPVHRQHDSTGSWLLDKWVSVSSDRKTARAARSVEDVGEPVHYSSTEEATEPGRR